jgi:hypothetical protein
VASDPESAHRSEILISIPGISTAPAMALLADMPELMLFQRAQACADNFARGAKPTG